MEMFLKRSEKGFSAIIGENKALNYFKDITASLKEIDKSFKNYLDSEIAKFLFSFSQNVEGLSSEILDGVLKHVLMFTKSISDLGNRTKDQITNSIIRRSKNKLRGLFDLFKIFLEEAKKGNVMENEGDIEEIITHTLGSEEKRVQFTDLGGFLKRAERKYAEIIGEEKASSLIDKLLRVIPEIPSNHRIYFGSDISKLLFKFSENAENLEPEYLSLTLTSAVSFIRSIKDIADLSKAETNQYIINRSNREARNLLELYQAFLKKTEVQVFKVNNPHFDDILVHTFGILTGPKKIEEAPPIHKQLEEFHGEFLLAEDHSKWANAIYMMVPRYLDILPTKKGDKILDRIWNETYPESKINKNLRQKVASLSREDENPFMFQLLNILTQQLLIDEELDRALTGSVAFIIVAKVFIDAFSGRNALVRAIKINDFIEKRKSANDDKKKDIDDNIQKILEEDLKSLHIIAMTIKTVISVVSVKDFYVKMDDFIESGYPKEIIDIFTGRDPLKNIGREFVDKKVYSEVLSILRFFHEKMDVVVNFYDKLSHESIAIPPDIAEKVKNLKLFIETIIELNNEGAAPLPGRFPVQKCRPIRWDKA